MADASGQRIVVKRKVTDQIPGTDFHATEEGWIRGKQTRKIWRLLSRPADEANQIWRRHSHDRRPLAPIRCVSHTSYVRCSCPDEAHCGLRMLMFDVRNAISTILDRHTLADIVEITLRKYCRDKITPPFLHRSVALASILPKEDEQPSRGKNRVEALKHFPGSHGNQTHNGRGKDAAK